MENAYAHTPVLLNEVIFYLRPSPGQNFVDATLGGGGYTTALYEKIKPDGKVLAIDLDQDAIDNIKSQLTNVKSLIARLKFPCVYHHFFLVPTPIVLTLRR